MRRSPPSPRGVAAITARGATLFELLAVVVVLATLAAMILARTGDPSETAREAATESTLVACRDAIVGRAGPASRGGAPHYLADVCAPPRVLADLFRLPADVATFDPARGSGWRGPYVRAPYATFEAVPALGIAAVYGTSGDPAVKDAWGGTIVLQIPDPDADGAFSDEDHRHARIVAPGPDGILETPREGSFAYYPPVSACGDDLVLYVRVADLREPAP